MKLTLSLVSLLMVATAGQALAQEVVVHSTPKSPGLMLVERAFDSCASRFAERIFPGQKVKYRTELNVDQKAAEMAASYDKLSITMQAQLKRDDSQLAKGSCEVRRNGQVMSLSFRTAPAAQLVGLTINDIKLAMASR